VSSERASRRRRSRVASLIALALALIATPLRAEPSSASADTRAAAQQLFERGLVLLDAGDEERALDHFLRSRALVPGKGNTANAAHCLHELGRFDEALELYEVLATRFAADLSEDTQRRLVPAMESLRERVGAVMVTANVEGSVLIDGRPRGRLPLTGPVRLLGGRRVVRVLKDGYATFEGTVDVRVGETQRLDAVLKPLAEAGQLRLRGSRERGRRRLRGSRASRRDSLGRDARPGGAPGVGRHRRTRLGARAGHRDPGADRDAAAALHAARSDREDRRRARHRGGPPRRRFARRRPVERAPARR
jgi:tetratricopeptide (TPR) repeat protein